MSDVNIIGAGLAGCEAAHQLSKRGINVKLYECKPLKYSPAHKSDKLCELVCSNSLKASRVSSAAGLLKEEMRHLDSLLLKAADRASVPAGGALAVDREIFSDLVTEEIEKDSNIDVIHQEITEIPDEGITIVASGPLTLDLLAKNIQKRLGSSLSFYDAAAPIVEGSSVDMEKAFCQSRYDKGDPADYINCPLNEEEYDLFYNELVSAERAPVHDFDVNNPKVYEGCMPVEVMAQRGRDTLRFGMMKPVGLTDPKTGRRPYACLQLRKENREGSMYNLVGFQTNLKFYEQKRVFSLIPALENAEFVRYGVMHRNTFIDSPRVLTPYFSLKDSSNIFFAGQITGVEGYMESASSGIIAGINAYRTLIGAENVLLPEFTMIGSLQRYISDDSVEDFQPMGANFGILPKFEMKIKDKALKGEMYAKRSLESLDKYIKDVEISENNS